MDVWIRLFMPFALLLARIGAFFTVLPIFNWRSLPVRLRAAIAISVTVFFAMIRPAPGGIEQLNWLTAIVVVVQEILYGLALGLAASFAYLAVQQGARIIGITMGLGDAGIIDPVTRESARPLDMFFEIALAMLFLCADGHHLFLMLINKSYMAFPIGAEVDTGALAGALVQAGSFMLTLGLKLAAPMLAAFLLLSVVLAVLARVLPEMNILLASLPLRVGLGLFMAAAIVSSLDTFTGEIAGWIQGLL